MRSSYCMRHIFLYCTFNLPWFPFHCHRSKHKLWFLIPHNKVQKYRTTIVQDSRTPTPCLILVGHLFGSPIYHPPMDWVESPPPAWESEFPPTINFKHLLTLLPGCFLLMWDYERGSEKLMERRRNSKGYWWDSHPVDSWSLDFCGILKKKKQKRRVSNNFLRRWLFSRKLSLTIWSWKRNGGDNA